MQAPVHLCFYQYYPRPPPPPSQPGPGLNAVHCTLTHSDLPGLFSGHRGPQEGPSELPVNLVAATARSWLAACKEPQQVAAGLQHYAPLLRVQGWTLLIADCGKRGESAKARQVFRAVPRKNVWHHSAFIGALGACGQWRDAVAELQHLKRLAYADSSLQPNHVTYSAAIAACARGHRLDVALQLFHEMQAAGLAPDDVTYAIVLSTASRAGAWQPVEQLLEKMHSRGIPARVPIYASCMRQLCRLGEWNRALSLFLVMQDLGVPATPMMVLELAHTLKLCGRLQMAAHLLKEAEVAGLEGLLQEYEGAPDFQTAQQLAAAQIHMQPHPPRQQMHSGSWQQASAAASAAAADAAADACGGVAAAAAGSDHACGSTSSSGERHDALQQQMEVCFDRCSFYGDDDGPSYMQSDAETEEYAGSFASSSELSSSVATVGLGVSVNALLLAEAGYCSSALPSPILSPLAKPSMSAEAAEAGKDACSLQEHHASCNAASGSATTAAKDGCRQCLDTGSNEQHQQQQQREDAISCNA